MATEHFDVLIVGAGLSGIGAGYHLQEKCPGKSYAILEGRDCIGGTWDLFRYPGIRSDSDMFTLGYSFKPWTEAKAIADGPRILNYVRETASDNGIDKKIRFNHRVKRASWSSQDARWTVEAERRVGEGGSEIVRFTCHFLFMCSGYYKYEEGYTPEFAGTADFAGRIVHPQKWPEQLDYAGKRVVVIGSGATAVTLVPEMAKTAAHVTMLQRSPTYVVARPAEDALANKLRRNLSAKLAYHLIRWRNVLFGMYFFQLSRRKPERVKQLILGGVKMALGPDYDIATHFTPRYNPWDQRLCLVPYGDLFRSIKDKRASVVTNEIDTFTNKRHQAEGRRRTRGRHHRHRHRPEPAGARRARGQRRRPPGRFCENAELQGHDVFGRTEHGFRVRLHQRVVDAEMRPHLRVCLPPDQLHEPARLQAMRAA
ncbi:cation diffusion facilitator CzcD-associated flavoprotein CzcO [Bradyrhizobium sp. AZCC 2289]